jgi:RNA polymerase sigma-70 factor (sigma-E family)
MAGHNPRGCPVRRTRCFRRTSEEYADIGIVDWGGPVGIGGVAGEQVSASALAGRNLSISEGRGAYAVIGRRSGTVEEEFTAFVTANHARLVRIADLITGDHGRAEDLVQSVLIRTYLRWTKVRQGDPMGYIRAGLVNAHTDWWRRRSSREQVVAGEVPVGNEIADHADGVAGRDAVMRALAVLTRRERAVVVLRYYEDLTEVDIASTLGISAGTVKSACARALKKLRLSTEFAEPSADRLASTDRLASHPSGTERTRCEDR